MPPFTKLDTIFPCSNTRGRPGYYEFNFAQLESADAVDGGRKEGCAQREEGSPWKI